MVKKVPMLEQFVNGLKTLGVIDVIRRYPGQFLRHFVHCAESKTPAYLKQLLKLRKKGDDDKCVRVFNMLLKFVEECSEEGNHMQTAYVLHLIVILQKCGISYIARPITAPPSPLSIHPLGHTTSVRNL